MASVYALWLIYAAGLEYLLMCAILYAPGAIFYWKAKREAGAKAFGPIETVLLMGLMAAAVTAIYLMSKGVISPL